MDHQSITDALIELLAEQGVDIRRDGLGNGGGGLCMMDGKKLFILNKDAPSFDRAISCAHAAVEVITDLDSVYLRPVVRDFIDKYGKEQ